MQHIGVGEPYEPLLEAITRLCRQPGGDQLLSVLEHYAPTWLAQLPALLSPPRLAALQRNAAGTTRERMLRELTGALEAITSQTPLILWLEDLHWSDVSTLDWLAAFAAHPEPARLLLIGTFRANEVAGTEHRLATLPYELGLRGLSRELVLGGKTPSSPQNKIFSMLLKSVANKVLTFLLCARPQVWRDCGLATGNTGKQKS